MNIYERIFDRLEELHMSQIELSRFHGRTDQEKKEISTSPNGIIKRDGWRDH